MPIALLKTLNIGSVFSYINAQLSITKFCQMTGHSTGDGVPVFDAQWATHPELFVLSDVESREQWRSFRKRFPRIVLMDTMFSQVCELMGILRPMDKLNDEQRAERAAEWLDERGGETAYGTWVYYPWLQRALKVLEEEDFIRVRTNRNMYKITPQEQAEMRTKAIGVIGMSVGKAITNVLTLERVCGEIRIADYDRLSLSNLNRIQTSLVHLTMPKTTIVAREIAELDPYIKVVVFPEGISKDNIHDFLERERKLDLLLDECDSFDIKVLCRLEARKRRIPVVMETNDRGMIDIERFDLEEGHRLFVHHNSIDEFVQEIGLSKGAEESIEEIGKTIETWPQLYSEVTLGSGLVVKQIKNIIVRKNQSPQGRLYFDVC